MVHRRSLLAAAALLASGGGALAAAGLPRALRDPLLGELPICRTDLHLAQYMQGRDDSDAAEADAALLEALGLLEGHLLIGRALIEGGQVRLGLPHFRHPVAELYTWLEPRIAARGARPFEAELETLRAAAARGATGAALDPAWAPALAGVTGLRDTVAPQRKASQRFRLEHVATMVGAVASDYGESIERGLISNTLEYHDSAGFLRYAIATARAARAEAGASPAWPQVLEVLEEVRLAAYAQLLPPARAPVSVTWIRGRAGRVRDLADRA
jgi:hypothetical protein